MIKSLFYTIYRLLYRIFNEQSLKDVIGKMFWTFITIVNFERYLTIYRYRPAIEKNL